MKLIVGLGNPGEKYENTRHNLGFMVVDKLLGELEPVEKSFWEENKYVKSLVKKVKFGNTDLILAKPQTFMNESGKAATLLSSFFSIKPENIFVIHDDLDLPLGKIRIRTSGASAGHKGVQSIIEHLGTDKFLRVRLGIGESEEGEKQNHRAVEDFVLSKFSEGELGKARTMVAEAVKKIEILIEKGINEYMSKHNG